MQHSGYGMIMYEISEAHKELNDFTMEYAMTEHKYTCR